MDFTVSKGTISAGEVAFEGTITQPIDSDITLPEYVPDICKVLKCTITTGITSSLLMGERITVEGNAAVKVIYVGEDKKVHCYEQNVPFSRFVEANNIDATDCISVKAKTEYVNCRLVNQRRLDVHGSVSVCVKVTKTRTCQVVNNADGCGVQLKKKGISVGNVRCCVEKPFQMSEVLEIGGDLPPIAQLVSVTAVASSSEIKLISNKALVKGDMAIKTLYVADSADGELRTVEHILPISQIIELDNADEDCACELMMNVSNVEVNMRADSTGSLRLLDTAISVRANMSVYADEMMYITSDAYSTEYEMDIVSKPIEFNSLIEQFNDTYLCRSAVNLQGVSVREVLSMIAGDVTANAVKSGNSIIISGTVNVSLIVVSTDGEISFVERQLDYEYKRTLTCEEYCKIKCDPTVTVAASNFLISSAESIDVRVELCISASAFGVRSEKAIIEMNIDEGHKKCPKCAALTLYYPDENESVWSIARRYNTTVEAIMTENRMSEEALPPEAMLMIPRV